VNPAKTVEVKLDECVLKFETGWLAKQTDGAVLASCGGTVVLVAANFGEPREDRADDFLAMTVEYREKMYASGKFPGGFLKKESRPGDNETLTMRLIDRPIRPLFPYGFANEFQVHCQVLSHDQANPADIVAMNGSSAALMVSGWPFQGPLGAVRVGYLEGRYVVNPTFDQREVSDLDLVVAGTRDGIVMVEAGANILAEEVLIGAFEFAQPHIERLVAAQRELVGKIKVPQRQAICRAAPEEMQKIVRKKFLADVEKAYFLREKKERYQALHQIKEAAIQECCGPEETGKPAREGATKEDAARAYQIVEDEFARRMMLAGRRSDGRGPRDIRPITIELSRLPRTHGSAVFTRGETQALVTVTLGTSDDAQRVDGLLEEYEEHFMLHYYFPPFSVGEIKKIGGQGRREIGHGALAERALQPCVPPFESFNYTIRVASEILESNGSSSMASVCGGSLALMDAGVPLKAPVAGIAMGLVVEGDRQTVLTDILGGEDHCGDMDFKVAGTADGVTALQMDLKRPGVTLEILQQALAQAREGRLKILETMNAALPAPRADLSPYAPRVERVEIPRDTIGLLIGPGGKTIRELEEKTGTTIEVEEDEERGVGVVHIYSRNRDAVTAAKTYVTSMCEAPEIGRIYDCKVSSIKDFGAFVEMLPGGGEGLIHISQLSDEYVGSVEEFLEMGQEIKAKLISVDEQGKRRLSYKEACQELGITPPRLQPAAPGPRQGPRGGGPPRGGRGMGGGRDRFRDSRPGGGFPRGGRDRGRGGPPRR
jgi:polyribonucleotide nucleotidyltransferase